MRYIDVSMGSVRRSGWGRLRLFLRVLASTAFVVLALTHTSRAAAEPGDWLTVSLLTMGPGEHPFTKFGHTALWLHDARTNHDEIYNYGTFAFDSRSALLDSVQGRLPYWLSVQSLRGTLAVYGEQGRSLLASELALTPAERLTLLAALRDNALPEHRYYRYDYYRDNCATRVRDALDRVLGGRIQPRGTEKARMTYRQHTLRLVADDPLLYVGLDLAIGRETDQEITLWDEAFLPERLHDLLAQTTVLAGDHEQPLILSERILLSSDLRAPRSVPPNWRIRYWDVGLFFGAAFAWLGLRARRSARARAALGAASLLLGIPLGLLGCALTYLTFFSAHSAAAANYNVLLVPPFVLALPVAAVAAWRQKRWAGRLARGAATGALGCTALMLALQLLTRHPQANRQELALALPLWLGAAIAARLSTLRASTPKAGTPRGVQRDHPP